MRDSVKRWFRQEEIYFINEEIEIIDNKLTILDLYDQLNAVVVEKFKTEFNLTGEKSSAKAATWVFSS